MGAPFFSVVMPVYNVARYVGASIESILAQTNGDYEFIIIDDGSTDDTAAVVNSYDDERIRLVRNENNLGLIPTLNRGLQLARGKWIARQDGDDLSDPERLAHQKTYIDSHPDIVLLGTQAYSMDADGKRTGAVNKPLGQHTLRWLHLFDNGFIHTSVVFNRGVVCDKIGEYSGTNCCGDYDFWSRIMAEFPVANLSDTLVLYREHTDSIIGSIAGDSSKIDVSYQENLAIIRNNLRRTFGEGVFDESEAALLLGLAVGFDSADTKDYIAVVEKARHAFDRVFPEARSDGELHRLMAEQFCRAGYRLLEENRCAAYALLCRGVATSPGVFFTLPLLKIVVLTLFGSSIRWFYSLFRGVR